MDKIKKYFKSFSSVEYISLLFCLYCFAMYKINWDFGNHHVIRIVIVYSMAITIFNYKRVREKNFVIVPMISLGVVTWIYKAYDLKLSNMLILSIVFLGISIVKAFIKSRKEFHIVNYVPMVLVASLIVSLCISNNKHYIKNQFLREKICKDSNECRCKEIAEEITELKVGGSTEGNDIGMGRCNINDIEKFINLKELYIRGGIVNGGKLNELEKLEEISLRDCTLKNLEYIDGLSNLKKLYIVYVEGIEENFKFSGMPNLEHLELGLGELKDLRFIEELQSIKKLTINYDMESLDGIEKLKNLKVLEMKYCDVHNVESILKSESLEKIVYENSNIAGYKYILKEHGTTIEEVKN